MMTFPQVLIGDELLGGFQEPLAADRSGRLQQLWPPRPDRPGGRLPASAARASGGHAPRRPIPRLLHGLLQYALGAFLVAARSCLSSTTRARRRPPRSVAGVVVLDASPRPARARRASAEAVPLPAVLVLLLALVRAAVAAPFLFGFSARARRPPCSSSPASSRCLLTIATRFKPARDATAGRARGAAAARAPRAGAARPAARRGRASRRAEPQFPAERRDRPRAAATPRPRAAEPRAGGPAHARRRAERPPSPGSGAGDRRLPSCVSAATADQPRQRPRRGRRCPARLALAWRVRGLLAPRRAVAPSRSATAPCGASRAKRTPWIALATPVRATTPTRTSLAPGQPPLGRRQAPIGGLAGAGAGPAGEDRGQRERVDGPVAPPRGVDDLAPLVRVADLRDARMQRQAAEEVAAEQAGEPDVVGDAPRPADSGTPAARREGSAPPASPRGRRGKRAQLARRCARRRARGRGWQRLAHVRPAPGRDELHDRRARRPGTARRSRRWTRNSSWKAPATPSGWRKSSIVAPPAASPAASASRTASAQRRRTARASACRPGAADGSARGTAPRRRRCCRRRRSAAGRAGTP